MSNLGPQFIKDSYQNLVQASGSDNTLAKGDGSIVSQVNIAGTFTQGSNVTVSNDYAHAQGAVTEASGIGSHAEGFANSASGHFSHTQGTNACASGYASHAEGNLTIATGEGSHAEGQSTWAFGAYSHTEGHQTIARGIYQHVIGSFNITSSAPSAFIIGNGTDFGNRSNLLFASGSQVQITGSVILNHNIGSPSMLVLTPYDPLPTTNIPTGSFMVSASTPPRPYMWDGNSWYAL